MEEIKTVYWLSQYSRGLLFTQQERAIHDIHGKNVEIRMVKDPSINFDDIGALTEYIRHREKDEFVYTDVDRLICFDAVLKGCPFRVFKHDRVNRQGNTFLSLAAVYHVKDGKVEEVWKNSDPQNDKDAVLVLDHH